MIKDPVWPRLTRLAACLCETIDNEDITPVCFCGIMPGQAVAHDYIDDNACAQGGRNGMAWVRLAAGFNTHQFPFQSQAVENVCEADYFAFTGEMGMVRSYPISDTGEPVDPDTLLAAASQGVEEMLLMRQVLTCCYVGQIQLGVYTPFGPLGGVIGGAWTFTVSTEDENEDPDDF